MSDLDKHQCPLVSVAIITYNQVDLIEETLSSVVSQTYPNIEIIIGDDCSTDQTCNVIEQLLKNRFRPYKLTKHTENIGITKNLNDTISKCSGKYIALLGGDDLWVPEKVETCVKFLESYTGTSFLCHGSNIVDGNNRDTGENVVPASKPELFDGKSYFSGKHKFYGSAQVLRRSDDMPMFEERILYASDLIHAVEHIESCGPALAIPDLLTRYRKSSRGVTIGKWRQIQEDGLQGAVLLALRHPKYGRAMIKRLSKIFYSNSVRAQKAGVFEDAIDLSATSFFLRPNIKSAMRLLIAFTKLKMERRK